MTKNSAGAIMQGLEDAIAFAKGDTKRGKARVVEVEKNPKAALRPSTAPPPGAGGGGRKP